MPVPSSGPVAISDLVDEFGGTAPHSLSEYYRNGGNVPSNNTNVPTAGAFALSNARGAVNAIVAAASSGTNLDISTLFGANWTSTIPKKLTIGSGVTIGGTGSSAAIIIPSNMAGTLEIENAGSVLGFGGAANGGAGGNAISNSASGVTVTNTGLLAGGGGGGGQGGTGGNSSTTSTSTVREPSSGTNWDASNYTFTNNGVCGNGPGVRWNGSVIGNANASTSISSGGWTYYRGDYKQAVPGYVCGAPPQQPAFIQYSIYRQGTQTVTTTATGGAGGSGGLGQGYNVTNTSGSSGATSSGAGTGGTGGAGATYGNAGSTGLTGANGNATNGSAGSSGGAAGAAVTGTSVTMNNTGTLHGAVA